MKRQWHLPALLAGIFAAAFYLGSLPNAAAYGGPEMRWTEMQKRYEGVFVLSASRESRKVALTFDDVPDPRFTPKVLDILKQKGVKATFFVVGTHAEDHPELIRRIHREGHVIGNHSYKHPHFPRLTTEELQEHIRKVEAVMEPLIGFKPRLIRPPYGEILPDQLEWAKKGGYTVVNWDVDSLDWQRLTEKEVYRNVTTAIRPGSVILMHAGGGDSRKLAGTVQALPGIIDWLREHDYEPVTLSELLDVPERK